MVWPIVACGWTEGINHFFSPYAKYSTPFYSPVAGRKKGKKKGWMKGRTK